MNDGPTLTLEQDQSLVLFDMILKGAKPADLFDTFDKDKAYYYIEAGIISNDLHEGDSIARRVVLKLGGTLPEIPSLGELPDGIPGDSLEAKLISQAKPSAIVVIKFGRNGEKKGFGFDEPMSMDQVMVGLDPKTGNMEEIEPMSSIRDTGIPPIPSDIKKILTDRIVQSLRKESENDSIKIKAETFNISGGKDNVELKIKGLEITGPPELQEFLNAFQEAVEDAID